MLKLYFSNIPTIISTMLILGFTVFFSIVNTKLCEINHWGTLTACLFFVGLFMSIMSGIKDKINTASTVIPANSLIMLVLSVLGALAFIAAIVMVAVRRQHFWQLGFYVLAVIIIIKTVITEVYRIVAYFQK